MMKCSAVLRVIFLLLINSIFYSCNESDVQNAIDKYHDDHVIPEITLGLPFDSSGLNLCSDLNPDMPEGGCIMFSDSFERNTLTGQGAFNWDMAIMDNGNNGLNVDAKIETANHLGHVIEGNKALLFRGRQGGSTHEIYLVSRQMDLRAYRHLYIQFRYVPLHLEKLITLTWNNVKIPESIRVDVCTESDFNCGLTGNNRHLRIRELSNWNHFTPLDYDFGRHLNIRNYGLDDWRLGQIVIDLDNYQDRIDKFVFKISVAMDEGYIGNNRVNQMEDGLILDDVIVVALDDSIFH